MIIIKNYENGIETRKIILNACKKLFYEKGYHETSNNDICLAAHVNRSAIYYHFKDKENIRCEVLWENLTKNRHFAAHYCNRKNYLQLLAIYIMNHQYLEDSRTRKFFMDYYKDYPSCSSDGGIVRLYRTNFELMYGHIYELSKVSSLAFQSAYAFVSGVALLADENPQQYTAEELFRHYIFSGTAILGIPNEVIHELWNNLRDYLDVIPLEAVDLTLL